MLGAVFVFHQRVPGVDTLPNSGTEAIWRMEERLGRPQGIINLCSWCKAFRTNRAKWYDLATFICRTFGDSVQWGLCPDCMDQCFPATTQT